MREEPELHQQKGRAPGLPEDGQLVPRLLVPGPPWLARLEDKEDNAMNYTEEDLLELIERHDEYEEFYREKLAELRSA